MRPTAGVDSADSSSSTYPSAIRSLTMLPTAIFVKLTRRAISTPVSYTHLMELGQLYRQLVPQDLIRYGLIPELVGRMPVITTLQALDADSLVKILCEPKNALVEQYKQLFDLDGVKLEFTDGALRALSLIHI